METKKYLIPIFYAKMNTMRDKNCHPWRIPERDLQSPPVVVLRPWRLVRGSIYTMFNTQETVDFKVLIRYKKASTKMEEACLMGFSGGFE